MLLFQNNDAAGQTPLLQNGEQIHAQIDSLIEAGNYFTARLLYKKNLDELPELPKLLFGVFLDYYFNQPNSSLEKMNRLMDEFHPELSDSLKYEILSVAHVNYSRQYEYKKARDAIQTILNKYPQFISQSEKDDLQNTLKIWIALQDQPKQEVLINTTSELAIIRDKAGLQNLPVAHGSSQHAFVFDTGANFSVITETMADIFELNIVETTIEVGSITGQIVESHIAVAPQLVLGDITIKNAVFLVFPDEALAFPQIEYQINGILGFPVIEALNEIRITNDDRFIITHRQASVENKNLNLALDFLTPLLFLKDERGTATYVYDTGASNSTLFDLYFNRYQSELSDFPETDYSFGGAGGDITKKGIYITFKPEYGTTVVPLDSTIVLKEPLDEENIYFGVIGQDFTGSFESVTINFSRMFVEFE